MAVVAELGSLEDVSMLKMKRNIISMAISALTLVMSLAAMVSTRGAGMEGLRTTFSLIIYASVALAIAFAFACSAMIRGEEPILLTLVAFALPPLLIFIALLYR